MANFLRPEQIKEYAVKAGIGKASGGFTKGFLLAFMGGMFIALAAVGSIVATSSLGNPSVAAVVAGVIFSTGLMMVVIAGGDLFTGNVLMVTAVMQRKVRLGKMASNLVVTFVGNFTGAMFTVILVHYSGLLRNTGGFPAKLLIQKAVHKLELPFTEAFILGILCNLLVCIAVWMMYSAKDTGGKVLACLFPITLFILSGYEHIVANMYYIPAAIFERSSAELLQLPGKTLSQLAWGNIASNFIPVTLGNLVGGLIIGVGYSIIYRKGSFVKPVHNIGADI